MTHVLKAYKPAGGIKFGMKINPVKGIYVLQLGRTVQLEMCT